LTIDEAHEKILADMNEKVDKIKNDKWAGGIKNIWVKWKKL
jgi:hypothetical protein